MEHYVTGTGQPLLVHEAEDCKGEHCVIHNPSQHCMVDYPTHWQADRGLMERICPHGVGHPDPDDLAFKRDIWTEKYGKEEADKKVHYESVHGCCSEGCCHEP